MTVSTNNANVPVIQKAQRLTHLHERDDSSSTSIVGILSFGLTPYPEGNNDWTERELGETWMGIACLGDSVFNGTTGVGVWDNSGVLMGDTGSGVLVNDRDAVLAVEKDAARDMRLCMVTT